MALETGTYISDLVATNPAGSDALAFADDHLRLIKSTVKNTFPNVSGAVTKTHTQLNNSLDKTGDTMTGALTLSGAPSSSLHAATKAYVDSADSALTTSIGTKADKTTTVSAGTGLSGGGDLSANRSLAIANTGVTAGSYGSTSQIPVIAVNAQGQITSASQVAVPNNSIGVGQTWQDVTSSRASGTTYTNSTSKPIMVSVFSSGQDSGFTLSCYVDGVLVAQGSGGGGGDARRTGNASFIVPSGSTYSATYSGGANGTTLKWAELR